jgi:hypothetical protein
VIERAGMFAINQFIIAAGAGGIEYRIIDTSIDNPLQQETKASIRMFISLITKHCSKAITIE